MKVALVGAGRIGAFHARTLARDARVTEIIVVDPADGVAERFAGELAADVPETSASIRAARSLDEAAAGIEGSAFEALVVCAPTPFHEPLVRDGVARGCAVFVEKPLAATVAEARALAGMTEMRGARVQVGFQRRYDKGIAELARRVASGALGTPYLARSTTHDADPPPPTYVEGPDGIFADTLVHDIDAIRFVTGREIVEVAARTHDCESPAGSDLQRVQTATLQLVLDDGSLALASAVRHSPLGYDVRFEVHGSTDTLAAGHGDDMPLRLITEDGSEGHSPRARIDDFLVRFAPAYVAEMIAFLDFAQRAPAQVPGVADGLAAQEVADAAWRSAASGGAPVRVGGMA